MVCMNCSTAWAALKTLEGGIQLSLQEESSAQQAAQELAAWLSKLQLEDAVQTLLIPNDTETTLVCTLRPEIQQAWMPEHNTLSLHQSLAHLGLAQDSVSLDREILVALLGSPCRFKFADLGALASHVRVRRHMTLAARKTALAFKTEAAERPERYWHYDEEHGFILQPGVCLIDALISATQPEVTGRLYDFSCYRASEYVILLGIAQELKEHHPHLLLELQKTNERHAIRSGQFHDVFLIEYGSMDKPLPTRYYVPGDRLWFRNPDERSSDVMGYEGSWVIYMGGGLFSNFWERDKPFTLESKAIEIYHWRDGVHTDAQGQLQMNEHVVAQHVAQTCASPQATQDVLSRMLRMRDPQGVYASGGCIDSTREYPRGVSSQHCELVLPVF
jgi:Protein-glutamine gamma-glutamyltransferase